MTWRMPMAMPTIVPAHSTTTQSGRVEAAPEGTCFCMRCLSRIGLGDVYASTARGPSSIGGREARISQTSHDLCSCVGAAAPRLLLPGIISLVDVGDAPRAGAMQLNHRLLLGPGEVVGLGLHDCDRAGRQWHRVGFVELIAGAHMECAGQNCHTLHRGVPVGGDLVVGREPESEGE